MVNGPNEQHIFLVHKCRDLRDHTLSSLAMGMDALLFPLTLDALGSAFPLELGFVTSCLQSGQIFFMGSHLSTHCVWNSWWHGKIRNSSPSLYSCIQMAHEGPSQSSSSCFASSPRFKSAAKILRVGRFLMARSSAPSGSAKKRNIIRTHGKQIQIASTIKKGSAYINT